MRVLLIDDDARLAELLVAYLAPQGVALTHAPGGQAGLAQVAAGGWDAVLLDVMMPGLDGLAVLRQLRAKDARLPVLMLTARGDESDRVVGLELGADDYVAKPFSPRELLARLRAVVRRAAPAAVAARIAAAGVAIDVAGRAGHGRRRAARADRARARPPDRAGAPRRPGRAARRAPRAGRPRRHHRRRSHGRRPRLAAAQEARRAGRARLKTVRGIGYTLARSVDEAP
jgi:two-component system OmpR family response regulator